MIPIHTYAPGSKCACGTSLDSSGSHTSSSCSLGRSLHTIHNTVLRVTDQAERNQGLNTVLELTSFSSESDLPSEKRPDLTTTSWPLGKSLRVADLAVTNPVSQTFPYSSTPVSLHPERLLKKREVQKSTKYQALAESKGGDFSPLATGASGYIASSAKKVLQTTCSKLSKIPVAQLTHATLMTTGCQKFHSLCRSQYLLKLYSDQVEPVESSHPPPPQETLSLTLLTLIVR